MQIIIIEIKELLRYTYHYKFTEEGLVFRHGTNERSRSFSSRKKTARKAAIILILAIFIAVSIIFGRTVASSSKFHADRIAYLEEKRDNAKALIGGANVTAFLISMIPDDTATPNANQIASIGKDFLIILSALTAEQYMNAFVIMLVTTCIIPILTLLATVWMINLILGTDLRFSKKEDN